MDIQRRPRARLALRACVCLLALCAAGLAGAAQFSLNHTRVHLHRGHAVETLVLGNEEAQPLSFEVEIKRWRQGPEGRWELSPSDALVVHPLILTVPAGGQARLRIGTLSPSVAAEEAYRVELQQLPATSADEAVQIRMLTRISVPVFVQPPAAKPELALTGVALEAAGVRLDLRNGGSGYQAPGDATLRVFDAAGQRLHESRLAVGYALAGAHLRLTAPIPAAACARAARIELALDAPLRTLAAPVAAGVRRCGR